MTRIAVVGFGLIGGSLALALKSGSREAHVSAIDHASVVSTEAAGRVADELVDVADAAGVHRALGQADMTVLATPVSAIAAFVCEALEHAKLVTDCGSTKRSIVAASRGSSRVGRFVPGHPMAGRQSAGLGEASAQLFHGCGWIVCTEQSDADAVLAVEALIREVGAKPIRMSPEEHDRAVALTSHVPQLLASALAVLADRRGASAAGGPAFASATRVAGGADPMWGDIFATNADEVAASLRELCDELSSVAEGLETGASTRAALELLSHARRLRRG